MFWTRKSPARHVPKSVRSALTVNFSDHELGTLDRLATLLDVPAGSTLTDQGTPGRQALVVVDGQASVIRDGAVVATLGAGEVIGEISLLTGQPRTATVVADTPLRAYVLAPREFASLLSQCPRLAKHVTIAAARRTSELATA